MSSLSQIEALLKAPHIDMDALAQHLNSSDHGTRMAMLGVLSIPLQGKLFEAAEGRGVSMEDMVPASMDSLQEVIHEGVNTLPGFRRFQKRFCRPTMETQAAKPMLWGYNHQRMADVTGPGYFVGYEDASTGEFWIDYRQLPPERPAHWPKIIDNKKKLGRFVYAGMVDKLRKVSDHVTIGRAYKGVAIPAWFTLVRRP